MTIDATNLEPYLSDAPDTSNLPVNSGPAPSMPSDVAAPAAAPSASDLLMGQVVQTQAQPQNNPNPNTATPPKSIWQGILQGALQGLAGSAGAKTFGAGLGMGAAGVFKQQQQEVENNQRQQQLDTQTQEANARLAVIHLQQQELAMKYDHSPEGIQRSIDEASIQQGAQLRSQGLQPVFTGSYLQAQAQQHQLMGTDANSPLSYIPAKNPDGTWSIYKLSDPNKMNSEPMDVVVGYKPGGDNGKDFNNPVAVTVQAPANSVKIVDALASQTAAKANYIKTYDKAFVKPDKASAADSLQKATAARIQAEAAFKADPSPENQKALSDAQAQESSWRDAETKQKSADAAAVSQAEGKDVEAMLKTGINPVTHERLSLNNAPDDFLVDSKGSPIPTSMLSTLKPTQQEINRADFAKSVLHSLDAIDTLKQQAQAKLKGPLAGRLGGALAAAGLGDKFDQEYRNYLSLAQSAATGAHVGGRFSIPILDKMAALISPNMDASQLEGAEASLRDVMQQYVDQGGRQTVAQYKESHPEKNGQGASKDPSVVNQLKGKY